MEPVFLFVVVYFLFPSLASLFCFPKFLKLVFFLVLISEHVGCLFEYVENSEEMQRVLVLLVYAQGQALAASLPVELSRNDFHLSHLYHLS